MSPNESKPTHDRQQESTGEEGKRAKELQHEPPPSGQDQLPPTDPAGEPQLA